MSPYYADDTVTVYHGDCLDILATLPDASVDAVVTDPPYGLEFMGKEWDGADGFRRSLNPNDAGRDNAFGRTSRTSPEYRTSGAVIKDPATERGGFQDGNGGNPYSRSRIEYGRGNMPAFQAWCEAWATECLRVLKPGGHLLAFGGTRTSHRLTCAIEDAGFEIRDSIAWLYGSGFPKSLDVSKAIDKAAGAEREVTGASPFAARKPNGSAGVDSVGLSSTPGLDVTAPATDAARTWQGWGTALKPAHEPVVVARKPLTGTVAGNVLEHGTGAINVDGCRVGTDGGTRDPGHAPGGPTVSAFGNGLNGRAIEPVAGLGRWPANVVLDETQAAALDKQSGESGPKSTRTGRKGGSNPNPMDWETKHTDQTGTWPGDEGGGASRFFYIAREDKPCPSTSPANTADSLSSLPNELDGSAPSGAATSESRDTEKPTRSPSTSAKGNGSRRSDETGTPETPVTASASSPASQLAKRSQTRSRATSAVPLEQIDTTTTTISPSPSAGSADPTTSSTTPDSVRGVPLEALGGSPFTYTAKADAAERVRIGGTAHPTVKPLALMRWLVRLVTPPGGIVLEPFAGSGTTVEACILEGFRCIAIEREADYLPLITQRIHRRRDPVAAVLATAEDGGLFDLLGEADAEPANPAAGGRWPPNVVMDQSQATELDKQSGEIPTQATRTEPQRRGDGGMFGLAGDGQRNNPGAGETGGASRFFPIFGETECEACGRQLGDDGGFTGAGAYHRWCAREVFADRFRHDGGPA